ncbi:hypothetical protein Tco_0634960 [Tanacetum coccineum]
MLTKPQFFYGHTTKQALGFQNHFYLKKAQQLEPKLYDGNVIKNTGAIVIPNSEKTLMLAEASQPGDGVTIYTRRRYTSSSDGVAYFKTASARADSKADLEDSFHNGVIFDEKKLGSS